MKKKRTIKTIPRFLYLNAYAFLLLLMGVGIGCIPCYRVSGWLVAVQMVAGLSCLYGTVNIFHSWADKERKYKVLIERNQQELRPDTFAEFVQAPCGRLLSKVVLHDLGQAEQYRKLLAYRKPLRTRWKENCSRQDTTVYINPKYHSSTKTGD